jgi:class 3 adenylate cyclase
LDYAVLGSVPHLASRLGEQAQGGNILVSQGICEVVGKQFHAEHAGYFSLKGQTHPVPIFQINKVEGLD